MKSQKLISIILKRDGRKFPRLPTAVEYRRVGRTVYLDESGTLPDPRDPAVVVAAISTQTPQRLKSMTKIIRKHYAKSNPPEIKFYRAGDRTKKKFLEKLAAQDVEIFVLIVEKQNQSITDSPENFALLCWLLLEDCLLYYQHQIKHVVLDRHFQRTIDQDKFNQVLTSLLDEPLSPVHVDSQTEPLVNVADMVAGSVLWAQTGKDNVFYQIIRTKIVSERVIKWKQIKTRFWQEKTRRNRRKRPSQTS
ncbi:DUF3800 domain-containing protein [Candidatus Collierbacteria bacterium]|nr:DUF3800 domain-containing protein [Candidatus Collierbacteria bacterium]